MAAQCMLHILMASIWNWLFKFILLQFQRLPQTSGNYMSHLISFAFIKVTTYQRLKNTGLILYLIKPHLATQLYSSAYVTD